MIVRLNDNTELEAIQINGYTHYFQGQNRDSLEFQFSKETVSFDDLNIIFKEAENTKTITLIRGDEIYLHENYSLRVSLSLSPVIIVPATSTDTEVTEERYSVVMAQKTYAELQQEALQETVDILVMEGLGV